MVSLLCLPTEVITRVLGFLSPKELASCTTLSKRFLTIIKASSILSYALELGKAGLDDTYHLNFDRSDLSPSELLTALRRREQAWSTFTWTKQWDVPVEKEYKSSEICGPVYVGGYSRRGPGIDTIDVYDFHDVNTNGLVTTLFLDAPYYGYAIDAGQDLLVLIEEYTPESPYYILQLRKLSTGLEYDHIEIPQSTISFKICSAGNWQSSQSGVQISGYSLLVKMLISGVSHWYWTMISETEVLLAGSGEGAPLLKYYTVNEFSLNSDRPEEKGPSLEADDSDTDFSGVDQVIFGLPFKKDPGGLASQTWGVYSVSSEASFTPKPFSPFVKSTTFVYPSKSQIIGIKYFNIDVDMIGLQLPGTYLEMFIHLNQLRKYKDEVSSISSSQYSVPVVPWYAWGPSLTRVFEDSYNGKWDRRCIRGYRVLSPDLSERPDGPMDYTILDFNVNSSLRDPCEVSTCDGIRITSSLPYKYTGNPFLPYTDYNESNGFGIKASNPDVLFGDDIICYPRTDEELVKPS